MFLILLIRPLTCATVTFPAGVMPFRLARRRAIINPAVGGAKLFQRRLAARRKFINLLTYNALLSVCVVIR